jgi:hypothetical protein
MWVCGPTIKAAARAAHAYTVGGLFYWIKFCVSQESVRLYLLIDMYHMVQCPKQEKQPMKREPLPERLRAAIKRSGKSVYRVAQESGVAHPIILRFLSGERDIRLETAEKLAVALGLALK